MEDPILRPRSKPRSTRGTTLSKVAGVIGATMGLAVLAAAAIVVPALLSSAEPQQKTVLAALPAKTGRIMSAAQSLESAQAGTAKQSLYHGVVYPPNYYGHYDDNGMYYYYHHHHPWAHAVHHVDVDGGTIGIGHHGKTWFVSHDGPEEQASG